MIVKYQLETNNLINWFEKLHQLLVDNHVSIKSFVTEELGLTTPTYYKLKGGEGTVEATKVWSIYDKMVSNRFDIIAPPIPPIDHLETYKVSKK